jgi:alkanesulfonate monooxygenase SsuD/methylene tetrahydromethanopterin reductase-like flavin-dependent oxidoreductase (luciferase family)
VGDFVNEQVSTVNFLFCHADDDEGVRIGRQLGTTFNYMASQLVSVREAYPSKSYKSLGLLPQLRRQATGPDATGAAAEGLGIGNPARILKAMQNWEACGVDRVNFILNCQEEIPKEQVLQSLRLFAREVMPHFQSEAPSPDRFEPAVSAAQ